MRRARAFALFLLAVSASTVAACSVDVDLGWGGFAVPVPGVRHPDATPTPTLPPCALQMPTEWTAFALYVSSSGAIAGGTPNGSIDNPYPTINDAIYSPGIIGTAVIFVQGGDYLESIYFFNSVPLRIYGSFAPGFGARDEEAYPTRIRATGAEALGLDSALVHLDGLELLGADLAVSGAGQTSYGIRAANSTISVHCVAVRAGNGGVGLDGPSLFGGVAPPPPPPPAGDPPMGEFGGPGGAGCFGAYNGGAGGNGGSTIGNAFDDDGFDGDAGGGPGSGGGGEGGAGGMASMNGANGTAGVNGTHGPGGGGGLSVGDPQMFGWIPLSGLSGSSGSPGFGGGGGGGGGLVVTTSGGGGGGGGGGGCGGNGGNPGSGGGGSIAVYLAYSTLSGTKLLVETAQPGAGGAGTTAQLGQIGGDGTAGGQVTAGGRIGGTGARGGDGGHGGGGGGGAGGASVGIFLVTPGEDLVADSELFAVISSGGLGGAGGVAVSTTAGFSGQDGFPGLREARFVFTPP